MKEVNTVLSEQEQLPAWLRRGIKFQCVYFDDKLYRFIENASGRMELEESNDKRNNRLITVVSGRHYDELVRVYPVEKPGELQKLLKLEFEGRRFHFQTVKVENGKSTVNVWQYHSSVPPSLVVIPETFLLAKLVTAGQVLTLTTSQIYFVSNVTGVVHSQLLSSLIKDSETFAMSIGLAKEVEDLPVTSRSHAYALLSGIRRLTFGQIYSFFSVPEKESFTQRLKPLFLPLGILISLYLIGTSIYLYGYKSYLENGSIKYSDSLGEVLAVEDQLNALQTEYSAISEFHDAQPNVKGAWGVLFSLFEAARINSISFSQERFVVNGSADKATSILELVSTHPDVSEAKFDNPTRNNRGKELFVISFTLKPASESRENVNTGAG